MARTGTPVPPSSQADAVVCERDQMPGQMQEQSKFIPESKRPAGHTDSQKYRIDVIRDPASWLLLQGEWNALFESSKCSNVFMTYAWLQTWWKHFGAGKQLLLLTARDEQDHLVGIGPFYVGTATQGPLRFRRLGFLGDTDVGSDYLGLLAAPGSEESLAEQISSQLLELSALWDYIELSDAEDTPAFAKLCSCLRDNTDSNVAFSASRCHQIALPGTFEEYLAGASSRIKSVYKRRWRSLRAEHNVAFEVLQDPEDVINNFPELIRLHAMRFDQQNKESAILNQGVPEFQMEAAAAIARTGCARLFLLRVDGNAVAALYGFAAGNTFQYYQSGLDPDWMRVSAGKLVMGAAIEETIRCGFKVFDFLRGEEPYKTDWANGVRVTLTQRFFTKTPASRTASLVLRLRAKAGRSKRDLQAKWAPYLEKLQSGVTKPATKEKSTGV